MKGLRVRRDEDEMLGVNDFNHSVASSSSIGRVVGGRVAVGVTGVECEGTPVMKCRCRIKR